MSALPGVRLARFLVALAKGPSPASVHGHGRRPGTDLQVSRRIPERRNVYQSGAARAVIDTLRL